MPSDQRARVLLAACALAAGASPAGAQTRFEWATGPVDLARYERPENCVAAVDRIRAGALRATRRDTLPASVIERLPEPPAAAEAARHCIAHIAGDRLPARIRPLYDHLLLVAGLDDQFAAAVERRVDGAGSDVERRAAIGGAAQVYLSASPKRLDAVAALGPRLDSLGASPQERLALYGPLVFYARLRGDTALVLRVAARAIQGLGQLYEETGAPLVLSGLVMAELELGSPRPLEVLRDSGETAYLAFLRRRGAAVMVRRGLDSAEAAKLVEEVLLDGIGGRAAPLEADYWYRADGNAGPRPAPGAVSLLVFVDHRCRVRCYPQYAMVRRLARRFGDDLDVTLVAQTLGFYRRRPPPSPAEEAELIREHFLDELKLPGALGVAVTPFSRLPAPDRRVVAGPVANGERYDVSPGWTEQLVPVRLVGPGGTILFRRDLRIEDESELAGLIEAMIASRDGARTATTGGPISR